MPKQLQVARGKQRTVSRLAHRIALTLTSSHIIDLDQSTNKHTDNTLLQYPSID